MLFDPITNYSLEELKLTLTNKLEAYFKNITITELSLTSEPDTQSVTVTVSYRLNNNNQQDTAVINIQNA